MVPVEPNNDSDWLDGERNLNGSVDKPRFEGLRIREIRYIPTLA
jgi:hypothetical protein